MKKIIYLTILCWSLIASPAFSQNNFLDFNNPADYVLLGDLGTVDNWTIETWFKYNTLANYENLYSSDDLNSTNLIRMEISATWSLGDLYIYINNSGKTIAPDGTLTAGWHHVAVVGDKTNNKLYAYLDGVKKLDIAHSSWPSAFPDFVLGRGFSAGGERDFNGLLDEFRIWNVARTEMEIQDNMNVELTGNEAGLLAYYNFNQGTCAGDNTPLPSLIDNSIPGGNDGTMYGFSGMDCTSNFVCVTSTCPLIPDNGVAGSTPVPTLSQWGLIILTLLLLSFGTVAIRSRQLVLAGTRTSSSFSFRQVPFDKDLFIKILLPLSVLVLAIFSIAIWMFGYELTTADLPGSLVAVPLLAYLLHLLGGEEGED